MKCPVLQTQDSEYWRKGEYITPQAQAGLNKKRPSHFRKFGLGGGFVMTCSVCLNYRQP